MDFRIDSSIILILRCGIPRPIGNSPESLSQVILVGVMLVGGLGVHLAETAHLVASTWAFFGVGQCLATPKFK